ncbi:MAG: 50S ribosomal protein L4 [Planctomycetota bacterium]|jgi:large subunit ribosomal protein L4
MPEIGVKNIENKNAGTITLSEELFSARGKDTLMHEAVINYLANQRQGTAATKTRGLVRGGGKKPYRQKGTGRARAGSNRSPIWKGGGTVFGPSPRDYSYKMPKKARKRALYAAIAEKIKDDQLVVIDNLSIKEPKTKEMIGIMGTLGLDKGSLLIVLKETDRNVLLSARNIPGVRVMQAGDLHVYDVLSSDRLLSTKDAMESLQQGAGE